MAAQTEHESIVRDTFQFLRLMEAKYVIVVDEDVRQSLAEAIATLVGGVKEHAAEGRK